MKILSVLRWYFWSLVAELAVRGWIPSKVSTKEAEETRKILLDAVTIRKKKRNHNGLSKKEENQ